MRLHLLILFTLLAGVLPASASARVDLVARDEPLVPQGRELSALSRALAPRVAPGRFNLVGLHWRGSGTVEFRTRSARGPWSAWNDALPEREDRPDTGAAEGRPTTWTLGNPWWTGPARWIQYRLNGDVAALRAYFLWSPPRAPLRVPTSAERPLLISRSGWGADESIVREAPLLAPELHLAVVHHTAGANSYSREDSAAIVRGIEVYHVKANGWNDIGYNFLVDKYGQVFEGRAGGIDQNVVGAHAQGFNTGSVGVAVLGTYGAQSISPEARTALVDLLAWRLDIAHVDPLSTLAKISGGNERFSPGEVVTLRAISGHRDTGSTACPGGALYAALDELAAKVAARGLPKLYEPAAAPRQLEPLADGSVSPVVLTARLSGVLPWSITVMNDETGAVVASASGTGSSISWTWDGTGPDGQPVDLTARYVVTISAPGVTPATMVLSPRAAPPGGSGMSVDITDLGIAPAVITPNGDGKADRALISFVLSAAGHIFVRVEDAAGAVVAVPIDDRELQAGYSEVSWDGSGADGSALPDGSYTVVVTGGPPDAMVSRSAPIVVDRALGSLSVSPSRFSPNGDGRLDRLLIDFGLARSADVQVTLRSGSSSVLTLLGGVLPAGQQHVEWDGAVATEALRDGPYTVRVEATTTLGTRRLAGRVIVDRQPPSLRVLSAVTRRNRTIMRLMLNETARIEVRSDGNTRAFDRAAGTRTLVVPGSAHRLRLKAWDAAGNASQTVSVSPRR